MRKVAQWALVLGLCLCAGGVRGAETGTPIDLGQLKKTVAEQGKQIEELRAEIAQLKNVIASATTKPAPAKLAATRPAVTPGTLEQRTAAMNKSLDRVINDVVLDPILLSDLPAKLKTLYGLDVEIDSKALDSAGIKDNTPLAVNVHQVKLSEALRTLLASSGGPGKKLDYEVEDGFVKISTQEVIANITTTQIYDIRDLLTQMSKASPQNVRDHTSLVREITDSMQAVVMPASWRDSGGSVGSIREMSGLLYIAQTKRAHAELNVFFKNLREKLNKR